MIDLDEHRYNARDVSEAADVNPRRLQNWITRHRESFVAFPDSEYVGGGEHGRQRCYTFRNVVHFAVGKELSEKWVPLKPALDAAARFAYFALPFGDEYIRRPAMPFYGMAAAQTVIVVDSNGQSVVIPDAPKINVRREALRLLPRVGNTSEVPGLLEVAVDEVWRKVCCSLELEPAELLRSVYGGGNEIV